MSSAVSVLRLDVVPFNDGRNGVMQILPVVDQRNLVEIVGDFERSKGYEPSAGYGGIVPAYFRFGKLDRYYLGEQEPWTNGKAVALLACDCGELGCWQFKP